jgi:rod shape-determining protein MreC
LSWIGNNAGAASLVFIALLAFAFSSINPQGVDRLRSGTADAFAPVLQTVSRPIQEAAAFVRNVSGLAEMQAENMRLEKENMRLREWYQAALVLEAENNSLRDLLNLKLEPQNNYITAQILSDSGNTFVKSLLVSAGIPDGVKKGQAVISGDGVVGRVIESGDKVARVLLLTDINSRVPVMVENTRQHAVLAGDNEQVPMLVHLPPDSQVAQGARIITSGHGGIFPYGLPVGRVVYSADKKPQVELFADFDRMVYVRIVDRPEDPNLRQRVTEP